MNDKNIENPNNFISIDKPITVDNSVLERYQQMMNDMNVNEKVLSENDVRHRKLTLKNNRRKEKERRKHNAKVRNRK
jgi:hypothetical protein